MSDRPTDKNLRRGGPGRPKGARTKTKLEIEAFARNLIESSEYRASLKARILDGKAPHMEPLLFHYGYGKPIERVRLSGDDGGPIQVTDPFVHALLAVWAQEHAYVHSNGAAPLTLTTSAEDAGGSVC